MVGESFSEIFFGNAVALGMPCVCATSETVAELMRAVEADPAAELDIDLDGLTAICGSSRHHVTLPAAARDSFLGGTWDATALLLERVEDVDAVARRLPYVSGW